MPAYSCLSPSTTSTESGPQVLFVLMRPVPFDCHVARAADAGADDLTQAVLVVAFLEQPHEVGLRAPADGVAVVDLVARVVLGLKLANLVAVLGVLHLEGLVEVGVGIAEAGRHKAPVGVDHLGGVPGRDLADRRDDAVLHGDVQGGLGPEHVAALDKKVVGRLGPGSGDGRRLRERKTLPASCQGRARRCDAHRRAHPNEPTAADGVLLVLAHVPLLPTRALGATQLTPAMMGVCRIGEV